MKNLTQTKLILLTVLFLVATGNYTFFSNVLKIYPLSTANAGFLFSLVVTLISFNLLLFTIFSSKYTTKPLLILVVVISSLTNYFMNAYNVVIDHTMIQNIVQTNIDESFDLLSMKQIIYFVFLGLIPAYLIYKSDINYRGFKSEAVSKLKYAALSILIIGSSVLIFSKHYSSFFREHKPLRYTINPTYWIYSAGNYIHKTRNSGPVIVKKIGEDAKVVDKDDDKSELVILVVGEAARADHFSLNGYGKKTNPLLEKEELVNFSNMYSCGTSTAESVPCMFSIFGRDSYDYEKSIGTENILDVLNRTGFVNILWRDNNSDSKGVATRMQYEDFRTSKNNTVCDTECRDEGMLVGLDEYIQKHKKEDILIVLHQMGNHGPAYYKRYPKKFEKFTPVCKSNQFEECTQEEINNAYDNAILYSDYFLNKSIDFLKQYDKTHETALIYLSDHGESLGENGLYLHGLPYFMAPDSQKHVGSFIWFGEELKKEVDISKLENNSKKQYSQDNLFHTLLGLFEVQTKIYDKDKDIINGS